MTEHSPLPWETGNDPACICAADGRFVADCYSCPGATTDANAALIVERVNGWDALVAREEAVREERDELRACIETLVDMLPSCDVRDGTHVSAGCYLCRARALVRP